MCCSGSNGNTVKSRPKSMTTKMKKKTELVAHSSVPDSCGKGPGFESILSHNDPQGAAGSFSSADKSLGLEKETYVGVTF